MVCDTGISESGEVKTELHSDEFNVLLAALRNVTVLYRQQYSRVRRKSIAGHDVPLDVTTAQYHEGSKVVPTILKVSDPFVDNPVHCCCKIQLVT